MARFTGVLGMLVILAGAYLFSTSRKSIQLKTVLWGLGLQLTLGYFVLRSAFGGKIFSFLGAGANKLLSFSYAAEGTLPTGFFLRVPGAPHDHLHRRLFRRALSHRRHAAHHPCRCLGDDPRHGSQRRRIPQRRRQHLHGADRGPAYHPPVSPQAHQVRTHVRHDQRHGPHLRRHDGRLHPGRRRRSKKSPHRRHHDRTRHAPHGQNAGPRNRATAHRRPRRSTP